MNVTVDISWPSTLPLPYIDYNGTPRNSTTVGPIEDGNHVQRRSRSRKAYFSITMQWVLKPSELEAFQTFFDTTLGNGTAAFSIELRFPKNSELTEWMVRFDGDGYQTQYQDGLWQVSADLDLITPIVLEDEAAVIGYAPFLVEAEESGVDPEVFETSDGHEFYVVEES